jgi:16S rRNA pseudouridine516 synthase
LLRLDVLLARNLGWSRTAARRAIADEVIRTPGGPALDESRRVAPEELPLTVEVDGTVHQLFDVARVLLNKPIGCVTALRDPRHPTAYALLREAPLHAELRPVGRLDLDTSGLLFWTTDGQEIQRLTHPKRAVPRVYQAALAAPFQPPPADFVLEDGHRPQISDLASLPRADAHPSLTVPDEARELATVTITGGAYHEVRRIFAALGSHVLGLCRVRFGDFVLPPDLPPGAFRLVSSDNRPLP